MELVKKQIRRNQMGKSIISQFVMDNDYNVPDVKKDICRIITEEGKILVDEVRPMEQYVRVKGRLEFQVLYAVDEGEPTMDALNGQIPFEEMIYVEEKDVPYVLRDTKVEMSIAMIHSRKINMKAMVEMEISSEIEMADALTEDVETEKDLFKKKQKITLLKLCTSKKDIYRIKEEMQLPGTKETIGSLLWADVSTRKTDTKLAEGELIITGELLVFCFYESPDGKLDWVEQVVPYEGCVECQGANVHMYHYVNHRLTDVCTDTRADEDGELRSIGIEGTLEMRIAVYEEEQMELLSDVYSLSERYDIETECITYEEPLLQNHSKCKLTERLVLPELKDDILQICHSNGMVQVDSTQITNDGIQIEGVLHINFLYVKADDRVPFGVWKGMIPFSHLVAAGETVSNMKYDITSALEQLSVSLLGGDSVEVKAVLAFHSFLRNRREALNIVEMHEGPYPDEEKKRPGIVGYQVKDGDDLWSLAKRYRTTIKGICDANDLKEETLKTGQRILILKENVSIL